MEDREVLQELHDADMAILAMYQPTLGAQLYRRVLRVITASTTRRGIA
jgi:hypothetical protein